MLVGVLKGSFIFLADLSRRLTIPRTIEFIAISSYGSSSVQTGAVRLLMDVRGNIEGKHVLIVEDIVDTGHTLHYLIGMMESHRPATVRSCALLHKPARSEVGRRYRLHRFLPFPTNGSSVTDWILRSGTARYPTSASCIRTIARR